MKPGKRTDRTERIKAVEREYFVAEQALAALEQALARDSALLTAVKLSAADLRAYRTHLHDTYFIRLFAEFETGLRDYWKNGLKRDPNTRIADVIASMASRHSMVDAVRRNADAARRWRNRLVHEEDSEAEPVGLTEARRYFGKFLGRLPEDW